MVNVCWYPLTMVPITQSHGHPKVGQQQPFWRRSYCIHGGVGLPTSNMWLVGQISTGWTYSTCFIYLYLFHWWPLVNADHRKTILHFAEKCALSFFWSPKGAMSSRGEREWLLRIREREGNEKNPFPKFGKGIRGLHSWEWPGTGREQKITMIKTGWKCCEIFRK